MNSIEIVNQVHNVFEENGLPLTAAQASAIADALIVIAKKMAAAELEDDEHPLCREHAQLGVGA